MCKLCDEGKPQNHWNPRRGFLKAAAASSAAVGLAALSGCNAEANGTTSETPPQFSGEPGRRYVIRGGSVMSMDPTVGNFEQADVLVEGNKIVAIGPNLAIGDATVLNATGRIVMPGFIDTHHHLFETALRSFLADGLLFDGLDAAITQNYFQKILLSFAPKYRPEDVYINTLFGALSALDTGVTSTFDVSQIHHTPAHSDMSIKALRDAGGRAVFGYFESAGGVPGNQYPNDARRIKTQYFSSEDQLLTMFMGGEIYLPGYEAAWAIGRELDITVACHIVGPFGMRATFDALAAANAFTEKNLFIHMTGMSDAAWQKVADSGAGLSLAVPIEMNMAHGTPPIIKAQQMGIKASLSSDVECTLTACPFTQMRSAMALQRMFVNANTLNAFGLGNEADMPDAGGVPRYTAKDVIGMATMNGARDLKLDRKVGSLTPGKEADIILLDATKINVAPLNHVPGAVVSLMDRTNVETVIVAGRVRKLEGKLLDVDLPALRAQLEASRDYLFNAAGMPRDLFRAP